MRAHAARRVLRGVGLIAAGLMACASRGDSDEAWLHRAETPEGLKPLLVLILDRSEATAAAVPVGAGYDPSQDYAIGLPADLACDASRAYLRRGTTPMPDCRRQAGVDLVPRDPASGLQCDAARWALAAHGFYVASRAAQWRAGPAGGHWNRPDPDHAGAVECRADRGVHGASAGAWFAADGTGQPWTADRAREIAWNRPPFADPYVFFSGNYLNFLQAGGAPEQRTIAQVMAERMAAALSATSELDVAIVRVDDDGPDGGYVGRAPAPSHVAAVEMQAIAQTEPGGAAPLGETLSETARWLAGSPRHFGIDGRTDPAALAPGASTYRSPFEHACRPVSLGYLTAAEPSADESAGAGASGLPHFIEDTGGCGSACLATLGSWLRDADLRRDLPGRQSVQVGWIVPPTTAVPGESGSVADPLAYVDLVVRAHQHDAAVPALPQLSAAALMPFDARRGAPGVILGLTAPRLRERWAGNHFLYAWRAPSGPMEPPRVVDRDGQPAIGDDGLPIPGTQSLWSEQPDADLLAGGAASQLPEPRQVYTDVASTRIADPANRIEPGAGRIGRLLLGLGPLDPESPDEVLEGFLAQRELGDPGLSATAIAEYPAEGLRVAYAASQDGLLHAFDADSGTELWAWMPEDLLSRLPLLVRDDPTTVRSHGIDGPLVLHRHDPDGDGVIEASAGEHLWLVFGLGRGGARYHGLDVSRPRDPRLLWTFELADAQSLALAEPVIARLAVADSGQAAGDWVIFLAGGYDRLFDTPDAGGPGAGSALHAVDATNGRLLWSAGREQGDLRIDELGSIAAAPRLLDLDGDRAVDRAYLVDVAGGLWRIDFESGRDARELASATRLARLGGAGRRFHVPPDTSIVRRGTGAVLAVALGSGSSMRPRGQSADDRVFLVYDGIHDAPARDVDAAGLFDATGPHAGIPPDAPGFYFRLAGHGTGEKLAGPTTTFDHVLRFQTYQPLPTDAEAPCGPPRSVARRYAIDVRTAAPLATARDSEEDEPEEIPASGLPPALRFGFPGRWDESCEGCRPRPFAILGGETFDTGYSGDPVRTSWRKLAPPASR